MKYWNVELDNYIITNSFNISYKLNSRDNEIYFDMYKIPAQTSSLNRIS